jgi:fibronectin-binding autotransporter adhesin
MRTHHDVSLQNSSRSNSTSSWRKKALLAVAAAPAVALLWSGAASAQSLTWDASGSSPTNPQDGGGNWDTASTNPSNTLWSNGTTDITWVNGDTAIFGNAANTNGGASIVTIDDLSGSVSASALVFNATPSQGNYYTIQASGSDLVTLGGTGSITVASGQDPSITAPIAGTAGLDLTGNGGTLTLGGSNTYSGGTTVGTGATLQIGSATTTGLSSNLGAGNVTDNGAVVFNGNTSPTITNNFTGNGSLQQSGTDTLTLTGSNSYTGGTYVNNGELIVNAAGNIGPITANLYLGQPTVLANTLPPVTSQAGLVINTNLTVGNFFSESYHTSGSDTLTIAASNTLTVNGNFIVGPLDQRTNSAGANTIDGFIANGSGALVVNNGSFTIGQLGASVAGKDLTVANLSGLNSLTVNSPNGEFAVGYSPNVRAYLTLANTPLNSGALLPTNFINVNEIDVGNTLNGNDPNSSAMLLGLGSNTFYANFLTLGAGKSGGTMMFASTPTSVDTVTIAGPSGHGDATITLGDESAASSGGRVSNLLTAGATANVTAASLIIGQNANNTSKESPSVVTFDTGSFTANTVTIASDSAGTSTTGPQGTLTIGTTSSSTGIFTCDGILLGDFTNNIAAVQADTATANFTINGGTVNSFENISSPSTEANTIANMNFAGGTLDMEGNSIGGSGTATSGNGMITLSFSNKDTLINLGGTGINGAGLSYNGSGTLVLDRVNTYTGGTNIGGSSTLQLGQATSTPLTSPVGAASGVVTNNGQLSFASNAPMTVSNQITGSGSVFQIGNGATTLAANVTNSYAGVTTINAGTLSVEGVLYSGTGQEGQTQINGGNLAGAGTTNSDVTLNDAQASVTPDASASALQMDNLSNTSGGALTFNISGSQIGHISVNDPLNSGNSTANINGGVLSFGVLSAPVDNTYTILTASAGVTAGTLPTAVYVGRTTFAPSQTNGNTIAVTVTGGPASLTWNNSGGGDGTSWDVQTNKNWTSSASVNPDLYYQSDNVTFNDSNNGKYLVNVTTAVSPLSVTVNNTGSTYTFTGTGSISGITGLTKNGSGLLILGNTGTNTYSGTTAINAGTLQLAAASALPSGGAVSVAGTLDLGGNSVTVGSLSGAGTIGSSSTSASSTLSADGSFSGAIQNTVGGGNKTLALTVPAGSLILTGNSTYTGPTTIDNDGTLQIGAGAAAGSISGSTAITNNGTLAYDLTGNPVVSNNISGVGRVQQLGGGTLMLTGTNNSYGETLISNGAVQVGNGGTAGSIGDGQVTDDTTLIINNSSNASLNNMITGLGTLVKNGSGTVLLTGNNTFSGGTTVASGTLEVSVPIDDGASALGGGNTTVNAGAVLDAVGGPSGADGDSFGYAPHTAPATIFINGGTITDAPLTGIGNFQTTLPNLVFTGGTLTSSNNVGNTALTPNFVNNQETLGANYGFYGNGTSCTVTTNSTNTTAIINATEITCENAVIAAPDDTASVPLTFDVAKGTTPSGIDLLVTSQIVDQGTFQFALTMSGTGVMAFDNQVSSNTFSGGTTISSGTLQLGTSSDTSSLNSPAGIGPVTDNAVLNFASDKPMVFGNSISGTGGITVSNGSVTLGSTTVVTLNVNTNLGGGTGTVVLIPTNTYTGTTTISSGASLGITTGTALPASAVVVNNGLLAITSAGVAGFTATLASINGSGALNIGDGVNSYTLALTGTNVVNTQKSLTISSGATAGSTLDLGQNALLISDGGSPATAEALVQQYVEAGQAISTTSGAVISTYAVTAGLDVAYADASDTNMTGSKLATNNPGDILIEPALAGDTDLNGTVNIHDLTNVLSSFNGPGFWDQGNFNGHPNVDISDLSALLTNFNTGTGLTYAEMSGIENLVGQFGFEAIANSNGQGFTLVSVPEPASMGLMAAAGFGLLARRRRVKNRQEI